METDKKEVRAIEEEDEVLIFDDTVQEKQYSKESELTKNQMLRTMLKTCQQNQVKWRYLLADSWFSSNAEDKKASRFNHIDSLDWQEKKPIKVEVFHKNIKSNTTLAKSPTSTIITQSNHFFMSIYTSAMKHAFFQLGELNRA